ncbi:MAG: DUF4492 domain-containing protein [Bacteroidales bacterium]|nr:DUF4492 domain-containing protein [Bacteroidales bacterium]
MKRFYFLYRLFTFYRDGLKNMTTGRTLWAIVLIKLFIMFAVLKTFFFPDLLNTRFDDDESRAAHVGRELIDRNSP